jgi:hypothetical protein
MIPLNTNGALRPLRLECRERQRYDTDEVASASGFTLLQAADNQAEI